MLTQTYQIDHIPSMLHRIWRGIVPRGFFLIVIFMILLYYNAFDNITIGIIYGLLLLITCFSFFQREDRQVVSVCFNEEENKLTITYFHFFRTFSVNIPVALLNYSYRKESYGRGSTSMALSFYNEDKLIGRIMEKYNFGWRQEQILEMNQHLALIKNPTRKKYFGGRLH